MSFVKLCVVVLHLSVTNFVLSEGVMTCYLASWAAYRRDNGRYTVEDIDPNLCTHLIYAFVGLNSDGTIRISDNWLDVDSHGYQRFNDLKQKNPNLKTLVAIGGASERSDTFSNVVSDPNLRSNLVRSAIDFLPKYGFDGFDLDWEYPAQNGGRPDDKGNFVELLKELRSEFDKHNFLLTAAVAAAPSSVDISYDVPALSIYLDYINVMAYDFHGTWDGKTGENAPLYASSQDVSQFQQQLNVRSSIQGWLDRGATPQKIILGLGAYGRSFTLALAYQNGIGAPILGAGKPGPYTQAAGTLGYNEMCKYLGTGEWTRFWNDEQKVPYMVKDNQWVGYDDPDSIKLKVDFAKSLNLGGVMVWSIDTDDFKGECGLPYPIMNAIKENNRRHHNKKHTHKKHRRTNSHAFHD